MNIDQVRNQKLPGSNSKGFTPRKATKLNSRGSKVNLHSVRES